MKQDSNGKQLPSKTIILGAIDLIQVLINSIADVKAHLENASKTADPIRAAQLAKDLKKYENLIALAKQEVDKLRSLS